MPLFVFREPILRGLILATAAAVCIRAAAGDAREELSRAHDLHRKGVLAEARGAYQKALEDARAAGSGRTQAGSLLGLAQIDLSLGRYAQSTAEGSEAAAAFRALHAANDEALALTATGQARYYAGDSSGAMRDFEAALAIARKTGDRQSEITRLNNIGNVYFASGRYGDAFERYREAEDRLGGMDRQPWFRSRQQLTNANLAVLYQGIGEYRRALELYERMGSRGYALPATEQAQMLANMGTLYRRLGDPVAALEKYRAAQAVYRQASLLSGELSVLNNIGIDYALDLKNYARAVDAFTRALELGRNSGARRMEMTSLLYRGEALLRRGEPDEARMDFETALTLANELNAREEKWRADYGLARVADVSGDRKRSVDFLRAAVAAIEGMREGTSPASGRAGFLIERRDVYDLLIERLAGEARPNAEEIFSLMERSRARELQDRAGAQRETLDRFRSRLPPDTVVVEYWLGSGFLAALFISDGQARLYFKPLTTEENERILELPGALADPNRRDWETLARAFSATVLAESAALNRAGLKKIVVIPDGNLARIPFEALPYGDGLLIDRFAVSYVPFASAFDSREHSRRAWYGPWKKTMMAFADPKPGYRSSDESLIAQNVSELPNATDEVRNAAAAIGGRAELHVGRDARKNWLTEAPSGIPALHFATHAFADFENPDRSYILFAGARQGFDYLFLKEAASLGAARGALVTISACDSGSGQIQRGEGIESFGAAFLAAGASAVVTSLWRAGDRPSAELMTRFYAFLAAGDRAAEALRKAKLTFRNSRGSASHPAYWAAFVLTGDGDVRMPRTISWTSAAAAGIVCAAAAAFAVAAIRTKAKMA